MFRSFPVIIKQKSVLTYLMLIYVSKFIIGTLITNLVQNAPMHVYSLQIVPKVNENTGNPSQ